MKRIGLALTLCLALIGALCAQGMGPGPGMVHSTGGGATPMSIVLESATPKYIITTWSHAPTDATKVTISYWINFNVTPSGTQYMFTTGVNSGVIFDHGYSPSSFKHTATDDSGGGAYDIREFLIAPDSGVWHHVLVQIDTNQAAASDRINIYVDGNLGVDPPVASPSLGSNMQVTANGIVSYIGTVFYNIGTSTPDAKFAYVYLIDGQALTPSSFRDGSGHPISYSGTYGANGFFLNGNGSSLTDQSPSGNNWTAPNGITYSSDLPT